MKLPKARGNKEFKKHEMGDRLTQRQAILAKCADCVGFYVDGKVDCQMPDCPLYPFMPYRAQKEVKIPARGRKPPLQNVKRGQNQVEIAPGG